MLAVRPASAWQIRSTVSISLPGRSIGGSANGLEPILSPRRWSSTWANGLCAGGRNARRRPTRKSQPTRCPRGPARATLPANAPQRGRPRFPTGSRGVDSAPPAPGSDPRGSGRYRAPPPPTDSPSDPLHRRPRAARIGDFCRNETEPALDRGRLTSVLAHRRDSATVLARSRYRQRVKRGIPPESHLLDRGSLANRLIHE